MADKGKVKKKKKVKKGKRLHLIAEFCKQRTRLHVTGKTNKKKEKKKKSPETRFTLALINTEFCLNKNNNISVYGFGVSNK